MDAEKLIKIQLRIKIQTNNNQTRLCAYRHHTHNKDKVIHYPFPALTCREGPTTHSLWSTLASESHHVSSFWWAQLRAGLGYHFLPG